MTDPRVEAIQHIHPDLRQQIFDITGIRNPAAHVFLLGSTGKKQPVWYFLDNPDDPNGKPRESFISAGAHMGVSKTCPDWALPALHNVKISLGYIESTPPPVDIKNPNGNQHPPVEVDPEKEAIRMGAPDTTQADASTDELIDTDTDLTDTTDTDTTEVQQLGESTPPELTEIDPDKQTPPDEQQTQVPPRKWPEAWRARIKEVRECKDVTELQNLLLVEQTGNVKKTINRRLQELQE